MDGNVGNRRRKFLSSARCCQREHKQREHKQREHKQREHKQRSLSSGVVYATLCLVIFLSLQHLEPFVPRILLFGLIVVAAAFNVAVTVMIAIGRNGRLECLLAGRATAFTLPMPISDVWSRIRNPKRG